MQNTKRFILDVWLGSEYVSGIVGLISSVNFKNTFNYKWQLNIHIWVFSKDIRSTCPKSLGWTLTIFMKTNSKPVKHGETWWNISLKHLHGETFLSERHLNKPFWWLPSCIAVVKKALKNFKDLHYKPDVCSRERNFNWGVNKNFILLKEDQRISIARIPFCINCVYICVYNLHVSLCV